MPDRPVRRQTRQGHEQTATVEPQALDEGKLMEFLASSWATSARPRRPASVVLGDQLGLYRGLLDGPATADELAGRTGTDARYVTEWARGQAAGGYIEYDPAGDTYSLTAGAGVRADRPGRRGLRAGRLPAGARRPGGPAADRRGVPHRRRGWAGTSTNEDVFVGCERFFRPGYIAQPGALVDPGARGRRGQAARRAPGSPTSAAATAPRRC